MMQLVLRKFIDNILQCYGWFFIKHCRKHILNDVAGVLKRQFSMAIIFNVTDGFHKTLKRISQRCSWRSKKFTDPSLQCYGWFYKTLQKNTGTNEVSGTSEFLALEPPVRETGAGKSSLRRNRTKLVRLHIFVGRDLGDGLK